MTQLTETAQKVFPVTNKMHKEEFRVLSEILHEIPVNIINRISSLASKKELSPEESAELRNLITGIQVYLRDLEKKVSEKIESGEMTKEEGIIAGNFIRKLRRRNIERD